MGNENPLKPEELKEMFERGNFEPYTAEKIFKDARYNFNALKSAPFFGEETLGIYPKIWEKLGDAGYAPALYELGLLYYNGEWWFEADIEKSVQYHQRAAALGNADAMF